ncbi:MAG: damage-control phosphatase ARMT1 family protein [Methanomassiliicoccales archaeon]
MEMTAECVPCLLRRVLFETELVAPERTREVMAGALEVMDRGFVEGVNSASLATEVHRRAYHLIGDRDPYRRLKEEADRVAESLYPRAREFVESSPDGLRAAVQCAIAGNVMDFGIGKGFDRPEDLVEAFDSIVNQRLGIDHLPRVRKILEEADKVLFLFDNCGEAVFDKLLISEIQAMGVRVKGVAKGQPILTDVTREDAERVSLATLVDGLLETGGFAVGIPQDPGPLGGEMENADLILAKGMANFEALSDSPYRPIAYIMRAKCRPVAEAIGARQDDNVVRLYE